MTKDSEWSQEQVAVLKKMWAEGSTMIEIGEAVGRSRSAVSGKIKRLHLTRNPVGPRPRKNTPLKLHELNANECHYILDNGFCCAQPTAPGKPYCSHHCAIVYQPPRRREDIRPRPK